MAPRATTVAAGVLLLVLLVLFLHSSSSSSKGRNGWLRADAGPSLPRALTEAWAAALDDGTAIARGQLADVDAVWVVPPAPTRLLLLLHGCTWRAEAWVALGEHRAFTAAAVARGWAVLALTSLDQRPRTPPHLGTGGCWRTLGPVGDNVDVVRVAAAVAAFVAQTPSVRDLPLSAVGASSGGQFVTVLAAAGRLRLASLAVYIAAGSDDALRLANGVWPPTLFVHMPRDADTAAGVRDAIDALHHVGATAAEVRCLPRPLTDDLLARRLGMSLPAAQAFTAQARQQGWVNATDYLRFDGRQARAAWGPALAAIPGLGAAALAERVEEVLNAHYALHEMTSDHADAVLDWLGRPSAVW
jgi:dienelactone hydrolase